MPVLSENFSFIQILADISQNILHVGDSYHTFMIFMVLVILRVVLVVLRKLVILWVFVDIRVFVVLWLRFGGCS